MTPSNSSAAWWRTFNREHWFVIIIASLAWMFDCLDELIGIAVLPFLPETKDQPLPEV